jgi:4-hydroxy-2-oxoheptanedioate aldolase
MRESHCKSLWKNGQRAEMLLLNIDDLGACERTAAAGWDCLWIDLEHAPRDTGQLNQMCQAIRASAARSEHPIPDVIARPGRWEWMRMGRLLEAGAHGIMYPRCESADEAREAVKWCKFAPLGQRGFDSGNADNGFGLLPPAEYVAKANAETWLAIQIESPAALAVVDEIAAVEGVDLLFFGPGDFSALSGKPGQFMDPEILDAAAQTAAAAHKAGIGFATLGVNPEHRAAMLELNPQLMHCGSQLQLMLAQMTTLRESL